MLRYALDELNSDRVAGWAFVDGEPVPVTILVDGREVGRAQPDVYRIDVAMSLADDRAARSGFEFRLAPGHFADVSGRRADVVVMMGRRRLPAVSVPVPAAGRAPAEGPGPLPPGVLRELRSFDDRYLAPSWSDELCQAAAEDLAFLVRRGTRATPELHHHLAFLGQLWMRAAFVERHFPRENKDVAVTAKDRSGVQNSATEVFCIGAHLAVLRSHGVPGSFAEFGCFKGFSTAILSDACHQLGVGMHVFDSFAGLPPSESTYYEEGEFAGSLEEVRANVAAYGRPAVVTYHPGYFSESLPGFSETLMCVWMDVDLESSSEDAMKVLPRLDPRGSVFSHECSPELFVGGSFQVERSPDSVVPPIVDAFAASGRPPTGRHIVGHTGAFWSSGEGIAPLATPALLAIRDLALEVVLG